MIPGRKGNAFYWIVRKIFFDFYGRNMFIHIIGTGIRGREPKVGGNDIIPMSGIILAKYTLFQFRQRIGFIVGTNPKSLPSVRVLQMVMSPCLCMLYKRGGNW